MRRLHTTNQDQGDEDVYHIAEKKSLENIWQLDNNTQHRNIYVLAFYISFIMMVHLASWYC